jgi:hypothetical protein
MTWCLICLLLALPNQQQEHSGFEIVELNPGGKTKKVESSAREQRVSSKPTGKPLEIRMPKQKKGSTRFQKPKKH